MWSAGEWDAITSNCVYQPAGPEGWSASWEGWGYMTMASDYDANGAGTASRCLLAGSAMLECTYDVSVEGAERICDIVRDALLANDP